MRAALFGALCIVALSGCVASRFPAPPESRFSTQHVPLRVAVVPGERMGGGEQLAKKVVKDLKATEFFESVTPRLRVS